MDIPPPKGLRGKEPTDSSLPLDQNTTERMQKLFFFFLLVVAKASQKKAESDMAQQSDELNKINGWINQINQGLSAAQEAKSQTPPGKFKAPNGFWGAISDLKQWADKKELKIDIEWIEVGTTGKHRGTLKTDDLGTMIQQLQNISQTLNAEIKNISTKVQKLQSDSNTFTELMSAIAKKSSDLNLGILTKTS